MKQLLSNSGTHIIVGLQDHAYVGSLDEENVTELELPAQRKPAAASGDHQAGPAYKDPHEIQAVAITAASDDTFWCAVTRHDKSLAIYKLDGTFSRESSSSVMVAPTTVHRTVKRAGSLCFAQVPAGEEEEETECLTVVIAGDLTGDLFAFPLIHLPESETDTSKKDQVSSSKGPRLVLNRHMARMWTSDQGNSCKGRRLLLGHTASMLTGVQVVQGLDGSSVRILTSDRDEKIRVSSFPDTHIIQGFLLGHTAFVSSIAAASSSAERCVSCGGDGTIRLWDSAACKELAVADATGEEHLVPSRVAMDSSGNVVAAIYDESRYMDLFQVEDVTSETDDQDERLELRHAVRLGCMAQPLSLSMPDDQTIVVGLRDPAYLQAYRVEKDSEGNLSAARPFDSRFCQAVRDRAEKESIVMPSTILEKDKSGQFKMKKLSESRGPAVNMPWNKADKRETQRKRNKRQRKRKHEQAEAAGSMAES